MRQERRKEKKIEEGISEGIKKCVVRKKEDSNEILIEGREKSENTGEKIVEKSSPKLFLSFSLKSMKG